MYIPPKQPIHYIPNIKNVGTQQTNFKPIEQKKDIMKQEKEFVSASSHAIDGSQISNAALAHKMSICSTEVKNIVEQFSAIQTIADTIDNTILVEAIKQRPKTPPPLKPKVHKTVDKPKEVKQQLPVFQIEDTAPIPTQNIEELSNTCCGKKCNKNCKKGACNNPKCRSTREKSPLKCSSPIKKAKSPTRSVVCPLQQKSCPLFVDKLEDRNTVTKTVKLKTNTDKNKKIKMSTLTSETVIQNPVPQEWVSPMVKALTIASDKPFNAVAIDIKTIERHPVQPTQTHVSEVSAVVETENYMREHHSEEIQQIIEGHSQHHSEEINEASKFHHEVRITPEILEQEMTQGNKGYKTEQQSFVQEEHVQMQSSQNEEMYVESVQKHETNGVSFPFANNAKQPSSPFAKALSIAPDKPFSPTPQIHLEAVPLPEFTEPYFPPARSIVVEPFVPKRQDENKSPFVEALTTAPERPYSPLPVKKKIPQVPEFMKELPPPPAEPISMLSALTVATDRPFTPVLYGHEHQAVQIAHVEQPKIQPPKPPPQPVVVMKRIQSPLPAKPASHIMPSAFVPLVTTFKPVLETYKPEQHIQEQPPRSFPPVTPELRQNYPSGSEFGSPKIQVQASRDEREYQQQMYNQQMAQQEMIHQQIAQQEMIHQEMEQQRHQEMVNQQRIEEERAHQQRMEEQRAQQEMAQREMSQQQRIQEERAYQHMLQQQKAQEIIANQQLVQQKINQEQMAMTSQMSFHQQMSSEEQYHRQEQFRRHAMSKQPAQSGLHKAEAIPSYQKNLPTYIQPSTAPLQHNIQQYSPSFDQHDQPHIKVMPEPIKKPITTLKPGQQFQSNVPHQTFQPVGDDHETHNGKVPHFPTRAISSSMINKPVPAIPHYQADIVHHECLAVKSEIFDPRSPGVSRTPSPILGRSAPPYGHRIERAKSPAAGPPPDPLAGRRSKTPTPIARSEQYFDAKEKVTHYIPAYQEKEHMRQLRTPEIQVHQAETVEQQFQSQQQYQQSQQQVAEKQYQAQHNLQEQHYQTQQEAQEVQFQQSAATENQIQSEQQAGTVERQYQPQQTGYSMSDSSFSQYQAQYQDQKQVGQQIVRTQATEDVKHLEQMAKSEVKTVEHSPDNTVQIQRTKKVSEEFERTQKVKTIEIERSSTGATQVRSTTQSVPQTQAPQIRHDPPHDIQMYNAQEKSFCSVGLCEEKNICQSKNICSTSAQSFSTPSYQPRQVQYGTSSIANFEARQQKFSQNLPESPIPAPKQFGSQSKYVTSATPPVQYSSPAVRDEQKTSAFQQYSALGQQKSSFQEQYNASSATGQQISSFGQSNGQKHGNQEIFSSQNQHSVPNAVGQQSLGSYVQSSASGISRQQLADSGQQKLSSQGQFSAMGVGVQQKSSIPHQIGQPKPKITGVPAASKKVPVAPNVSSNQGGHCVKKRAYETTMPKSQSQYYPRQTPPVSPVIRFQKCVTNPPGPKIISLPLVVSPTPLSHTKQCYQPSTMTPSPIPGYSPSPLAVSPAPGAKPSHPTKINTNTNIPKAIVKPVSVVTNQTFSTTKTPSGESASSNYSLPLTGTGSRQSGAVAVGPKRGRGVLNVAAGPGSRVPICGHCQSQIRYKVASDFALGVLLLILLVHAFLFCEI